jgi:glycosyltransferase involved in cell wall biosynthesis
MLTRRMRWESYLLSDACIALTPWEAHLMNCLFGAPKNRIHVVSNGVENVFFSTEKAARGKWLLCTATITERKRVLELAQAAVRAQSPVWIIGKAYSESDPYARQFFSLAGQHPDMIRYEGAIQDRAKLAQIYRRARGFVLLSAMETLSLASLEAAGCGCPLLLSDLPWARVTFGAAATYCPLTTSVKRTAESLREFYDEAPRLPAPPKPASWKEVGRQFKTIYEELLSTSR